MSGLFSSSVDGACPANLDRKRCAVLMWPVRRRLPSPLCLSFLLLFDYDIALLFMNVQRVAVKKKHAVTSLKHTDGENSGSMNSV